MHVVAVHASPEHSFSKRGLAEIELVEGLGVRNDAHFGPTVRHRSRAARNPSAPNVRQVHLLHQELLMELASQGFSVLPGQLGENMTTTGIDLLALSAGTRLLVGPEAVVEITGLRNPCAQIEGFQAGLFAAVLDRAVDGTLIRKAGVMGIVHRGGIIRAEDAIEIIHEPSEHEPLQPV